MASQSGVMVTSPVTAIHNTTPVIAPQPCPNRLIDESLFYPITLIPAALIVLTFAFTQTRRKMFLDVLNGRPGLIHPMDILTRSNRFSYVCAMGATVSLWYRTLLGNYRVFPDDQMPEISTLLVLVSILVLGLVYFPVFGCLTTGSLLGFGLGSVYTWMLLVVEVIRMMQCDATPTGRVLAICISLPTVLCLLFLSIRVPIELYKEYPKRDTIFSFSPKQDSGNNWSLEELKASNIGLHVGSLLKKPQEEPCPDGLKAKVIEFVQVHIYRPHPRFRYSARFLSTHFLAVLLLYGVCILFYTLAASLRQKFDDAILPKLKQLGFSGQQLESIKKLVDCIVVTIVVATSLALLLGLVGIARMFVKYRETLLAMNKGQMKHIWKNQSNSYILMCALKYSGYQVISVFWGFFIHFLVLLALCGCLAGMVWALDEGKTDWLVKLLRMGWPIVFWLVVIYTIQRLMAKYTFMGHSKHLVLDNRRVLFITAYFTFFYNIFLGIVSSLIRIAKSIVIGAILLPRLDSCVLPQDFASMDPGYMTFVGFMKLENDHTHPVMLTFIRLLQVLARDRLALSGVGVPGGGGDGDGQGRIPKRKGEQSTRRRALVFKWQTLYTLINNPDLRMERKGYIQGIRLARELGLTIPKSDTYASIGDDVLQGAKTLREQKEAGEKLDDLKNKIVQRKMKEDRGNSGFVAVAAGGDKGDNSNEGGSSTSDDSLIDVGTGTESDLETGDSVSNSLIGTVDKARDALRSVLGGKGLKRLVNEEEDGDEYKNDGSAVGRDGARLHVQVEPTPSRNTDRGRKRRDEVV